MKTGTPQPGGLVAFKRIAQPSLGKMLQPEKSSTAAIQVPYLKAGHVQWAGLELPEELPMMWASAADIAALSPRHGDLLVCEGGEVGRATLAPKGLPEKTIIQNSLHLVRETTEACPRYLKYALAHVAASGWIDLVCNKATIAHLTVDKLRELPIPYWDKSTQQDIANFLDEQTARIDALIAEKENLVNTLFEYRKAIISKAITQGLYESAATKPSGQPWLGDIPAHWGLTKLKHMGETLIGLTYSPADVTDSEEGVLVLRSSNVQRGRILLDDNVYVTCPIPEKLRVRPGDILICSRNGSRALIGKNATVGAEHAGMSFGAFMTVFRGADNFYVRWLLNSSLFEYHSASFLTSTINQLTTSNLNSLVVPLPPFEERRAIDEYLNRRTNEIDSLNRHVEAHISSLKQYRSSLISAAVTGQLDLSTFKAAA